ncbi:serine/threonine-protein kinase RsbW [Thermostichus sp. MS-CIW-21]|uniref:ATP-binding protein n=1 Tax=unclassified Synechococcus TaxID=2626047 RepID=UPI0023E791CC|nr:MULTISPECIES: ATP-binding protein [unclassified Synechococcus]
MPPTAPVIALSLKPAHCSWSVISFPSTLYTQPVLDLLIAKVPPPWRAEVRLGLQEAIINAVRHGNGLDPNKRVIVEYASSEPFYQWLVRDQGSGFRPQEELNRCRCGILETEESGRGMLLLTQIFDFVQWNETGNQLYLGKYIHPGCRDPWIV